MLAIDTRDIMTQDQENLEHRLTMILNKFCYYNRNKKDINFNSFLAVRQETSFLSEINFSIVQVIDNSNKDDNIYSKISDELSDFKNGNVQRTVQ